MQGQSAAETVVITGAAAGVGRATAQAFARRGANVGLIARGRQALDSAKREVEALGGHAIIAVADVADADQVEGAAQAVVDAFGGIDVWVNNAMASVFSPVKEMKAEEFKRVTEVTYLGYVYGTLSALKQMLPRDHGRIIQVGSALAYRGIPLQSAYCASKHAIQGFTESLRCELLHDGSNVKITMVQMPALNTPQFDWVLSRLPRKPQPVPPIYQPEVAAEAIYWAAHHYRRELDVGWPTILAVTANHFVPSLLDHYLARTGYASQQYGGQVDSDRPNNLWEPVPGAWGAHGDFDARATESAPWLWINTHRGLLGIAAAAVAALGMTLHR